MDRGGIILDLNWSLEEIYKLFDCKEFKDDIKLFDEIIENINEWVNNLVVDRENLL